jgi:hypothetical protein
VDIHNLSGTGTVIRRLEPGEYYEVPYRCLVPQGVENLLIGSRCISAMHKAHAPLRVMPIVAGIGEVAGVAAAWAGEITLDEAIDAAYEQAVADIEKNAF